LSSANLCRHRRHSPCSQPLKPTKVAFILRQRS
jgi:hypothetical protein